MVEAGERWPDERFLKRVGAALPIIQAPMAGAGGVHLAVAAIEGGALGSLPCGMLDAHQMVEQAQEVRARCTGPLNLNFFCHAMPGEAGDQAWRDLLAPYYSEFAVSAADGPPPLRRPFDDALCEAAEQVKPEVVSFHFGLPEPRLLARVKATGAVIIGNATSPAEARWLEERGVDAIIAQGWEAGGHSGRFLPADPTSQMGLMALLPQVAGAVEVPVIAAGGIMDGRAMAAAMLLGASAVQIGTAFLHCPESRISEAHRAALRGLEAESTLFTNLFTGGLARGLAGRLVRDLGPRRSEAPPYPMASVALAPLRAAAEKRGDYSFTPMWAGQGARLGRPLPARDLTAAIASEALALLRERA
jgi:nitronate monooxygenase